MRLVESGERGVGDSGMGGGGSGFQFGYGVEEVFDGPFAVNDVEGDAKGEAVVGDLVGLGSGRGVWEGGELAEAPGEGTGGGSGLDD